MSQEIPEDVLTKCVGSIHWQTNCSGKPASYYKLARGEPKPTPAASVEVLRRYGIHGWYAVQRADGTVLMRDGTWRRFMTEVRTV